MCAAVTVNDTTTAMSDVVKAVVQDPVSELGGLSYDKDDLNPARLKDVMKQNQQVLVRYLQDPLIQYLRKQYEITAKSSGRMSGRFGDLVAFQRFLSQIPSWNDMQVDTMCSEVMGVNSEKVYNALKFQLIGKVMLMLSVRSSSCLNSDVMSMASPTLKDFMHRVLESIARQLFPAPSLIRSTPSSAYDYQSVDNTEKLNRFVAQAIVNTITDLVPYHEILSKYLGNTLKSQQIDVPPQVDTTTSMDTMANAASAVTNAPSTNVAGPLPVKLADIVALEKKSFEGMGDVGGDDSEDSGNDSEDDEDSDGSDSEEDSEEDSSDASEDDSESEDDDVKSKNYKNGKKNQKSNKIKAEQVKKNKKTSHQKKNKNSHKKNNDDVDDDDDNNSDSESDDDTAKQSSGRKSKSDNKTKVRKVKVPQSDE
jgi:hypothetical protein